MVFERTGGKAQGAPSEGRPGKTLAPGLFSPASSSGLFFLDYKQRKEGGSSAGQLFRLEVLWSETYNGHDGARPYFLPAFRASSPRGERVRERGQRICRKLQACTMPGRSGVPLVERMKNVHGQKKKRASSQRVPKRAHTLLSFVLSFDLCSLQSLLRYPVGCTVAAGRMGRGTV